MSMQSTVVFLGPEDAGREVSSAEFADAEFAEPWIYERENGRLIVLSPEGQRHLDDSKPWRRQLNRYWIEHPEVVDDVVIQAWVRVDDGTDRIGDIGIFLVQIGVVKSIPERFPDIMFEVVSPGRESHHRDYVKKRRDYRRLGIREYVVINRPARSVTVFTAGPRGYRRRILRPGDVYESPLLPGLTIPLAEVI
jgi:Uma2 family endonuclease